MIKKKINVWRRELEVLENKIKNKPNNEKRVHWIYRKGKIEGLIKGWESCEKWKLKT